MGARSVTAIVIQSTIEILVGGDLILLGLVLRQVALPLEAACWWRWRLSRMDADAALTLARVRLMAVRPMTMMSEVFSAYAWAWKNRLVPPR